MRCCTPKGLEILKMFLAVGLIFFKREERKIENVSELIIDASSLFHSLIIDGKKELRKNSVRQNMFGIRLRFLKLTNWLCFGIRSYRYLGDFS